MNSKITALALGAALLCASVAQATETTASSFAFTGYNSAGTVDASVFAVTGGNTTNTTITDAPPCCGPNPGPGSPYATAEGTVAGNAYDAANLNFGYLFPYYYGRPTYFWAIVNTTDSGLQFDANAVSGYGFSDTTEVDSYGSFTLAAHSSLLMSSVVTALGIADSFATFTFALDGGTSMAWSANAGNTKLNLTLVNDSDVTETGTFSAKLFASSAPEPDGASLLLAGLLAVGVVAHRRQAA